MAIHRSGEKTRFDGIYNFQIFSAFKFIRNVFNSKKKVLYVIGKKQIFNIYKFNTNKIHHLENMRTKHAIVSSGNPVNRYGQPNLSHGPFKIASYSRG